MSRATGDESTDSTDDTGYVPSGDSDRDSTVDSSYPAKVKAVSAASSADFSGNKGVELTLHSKLANVGEDILLPTWNVETSRCDKYYVP